MHARRRGPDPVSPDVYGGRDLQPGGGWLMVFLPGRCVSAGTRNRRPSRFPDMLPTFIRTSVSS